MILSVVLEGGKGRRWVFTATFWINESVAIHERAAERPSWPSGSMIFDFPGHDVRGRLAQETAFPWMDAPRDTNHCCKDDPKTKKKPHLLQDVGLKFT